MRRFRKKDEFQIIMIPSDGMIADDRVLVGDQYAKYHPVLLDELEPETERLPPTPAKSKPMKQPAAASVVPHEEKKVRLSTSEKQSLETAFSIADEAVLPAKRKKRVRRTSEEVT